MSPPKPFQPRQTLDAIWGFGSAHERYGDHAGAESQFRAMLEYTRANYRAGHPQIAEWCDALVACMVAQSKFSGAEPLLLSAFKVIEPGAGESARAACTNLIDFYDRWAAAKPDAGHDATAEAWRAKMESFTQGE